ncbi:MAG: putative DNA-binding domain-containing protein [Steroidobacteraceae bacterium]
MLALAEFQQQFIAALLEPQAEQASAYGVGFSVYQNTVMKGLVDVLRANYPTVERLVGDAWFLSAALYYARDNLPEQAPLAMYGASFPDFFQQSVVTNNLPYLADVARIDRYWTEAHFAVDAPLLDAAKLQRFPPAQLATLCLQLHPAVRLGCVQHSALTIWLHNRPPAVPPAELLIQDETEYLLISRGQGEVKVSTLAHSEYEFFLQLQLGVSLGDAAVATLEVNANADIAGMLSRAIAANVFKDDVDFSVGVSNS